MGFFVMLVSIPISRNTDLENLQVCGVFLGLRVVYMFLYIGVDSQKLSFVRTLVWNMGVVCCMILLFKAGNVLVDGKGIRI